MCPQETYRAFISGTFADIADFRSKVKAMLPRQEILPVEMAERNFGAADVKADLDRELEKADIVLCIVGYRYGSRIDRKDRMPSWTHYEYETFRRKIRTKGDPLYGHRGLLVLMPKEPSEAQTACASGADRVFQALIERQAIDPKDRHRDREALDFFRRCISGGRIKPPPEDLIDLENDYVKIDLDRADQTMPALFGNEIELELCITNFLLAEGFARGSRGGPTRGARADHALTVPSALFSRLAQEPRPGALCAVIPRFDSHGLKASTVAAAIARANPWGDGDAERLVDWQLLTAGQNEEDLLHLLAKEQFGVAADTVDALCAAIAEEILAEGRPLMLRLTGIPTRGYARPLIEKVWPRLEAALRTGRPPDSKAGLLLLLSAEVIPDDLARFCQLATATTEPLAKPILITPAAFGLAEPSPAEVTTDPTEPPE